MESKGDDRRGRVAWEVMLCYAKQHAMLGLMPQPEHVMKERHFLRLIRVPASALIAAGLVAQLHYFSDTNLR
jgi:hypothetical protein